jgi:deoxyribonuclease-4
VGKSTTKPLSEAMENMRKTISDAITFATPDCPLLLETPAGQGTETLTDREEFLDFVMSFGDPRLALCVDTCHVFTNGHDPLEYLQRAHKTGLLRLVHFNDSASACGACVDRHAYIGTGHLGPDKMEKLAHFCSVIAVDMVVE